jgi:anti-sigma factor RsiW
MTDPESEMTCRELVEVITSYLEETMPDEDRRCFDAHLAECPYCVAYLEQMRATVAALGGLEQESIPVRMQEELLTAFRDWRAA